MKPVHIIGLVMILAAIGTFVSMSGETTVYSDFEQASTSGERVMIAGALSKDKEIYYKPQENPNYLSFYVKDTEGEERKVVFNDAKPQDFEQSETVVITGKMKGDEFHASEMLMKCPSKYKDEEIYVKSRQGEI